MNTDLQPQEQTPEQKIAENISVSPWLRSLLFLVFLGVLGIFWGWMFGWFSLVVPEFNDFKPFANDRAIVKSPSSVEREGEEEKAGVIVSAQEASESKTVAVSPKTLSPVKPVQTVAVSQEPPKIPPPNPLQFNSTPAQPQPLKPATPVVVPKVSNVKVESINATITFKEGNNKLTGEVRKQVESIGSAQDFQAASQISVRGYSDQSISDPEVRRQSAIDRAVNVRTLIAKQYDVPVEKIRIYYDPNLTAKSSVVEVKTGVE